VRLGIDARKEWDGGIGRYIRNLINGLLRSEDLGELHAWVKPDSGMLKLVSENFKPHPERARLYGFWEQFSLRIKANRTPIDLFHAPHYVVPIGLKIPLVVTIHDIIHLIFPKSPFHRRYATAQIRHAIRNAAAVITPSSFSLEELQRFFPEAKGKTIAILHGLEDDFFRESSAKDGEIEQTLQLPQRYLLYVGNHKPHKNLEQLLEVCREVFKDDPDLFLCVTGNKGDEGGRLYNAAARLGLEERVRFLGNLENEALQVCYRRALCFVFPSLYEGFGFPPLEAMASGTPVVAYRVASLPEVIGEGGILISEGDGKEFYEAVRLLVENTEARREWGLKGRAHVKKFSWEAAIREHIAVYRKILSQGLV